MISPSLMKKYMTVGPRYTSYPTVPFWNNTLSLDQWIEEIKKALLAPKKGAALYIHIPFCQALCTYCGCNTRITRNHSVALPYLQDVLKEWELYQKFFSSPIPFSEIHIGGGTPTFCSPQELKFFLENLFQKITVTSDPVFSIEADPRVTTPEHLHELFALGFSRLSLGIQDFDPRVQDIVHRVQTEKEVAFLTQAARDKGFESINYDLIYGLPLQTPQSMEMTMQAIGRLKPDRIAFYSYGHVPWIKPSQRRFTEKDLPQGEEKHALYLLGRSFLKSEGYEDIGMDHFALPHDALWRAVTEKTLHRNFMGYTPHQVSPLFGLGVSAIGDAWTAFSQNEKVVENYQKKISQNTLPLVRGHLLTPEDLFFRKRILDIMTSYETSWEESQHSVPSHWLTDLQQDGLIEVKKMQTQFVCSVTELGKPFLRNVCMAFDQRMHHKEKDLSSPMFSQTI